MLLRVDLALLALNVAHGLDHALNQGQGASGFGVVGTLGISVALATTALSWLGWPIAVPATALVGFGQVVAFTVIHVFPDWGPLSDPYYESPDVNAISWLVLAISIGISVYAGFTGLRELRRAQPAVVGSELSI
ncbi:MAG: hypothetical protein WAP35_01640 [Solirubrobacterales bacterium]